MDARTGPDVGLSEAVDEFDIRGSFLLCVEHPRQILAVYRTKNNSPRDGFDL